MMLCRRAYVALLIVSGTASAADVTVAIVDGSGVPLGDAVIYMNARGTADSTPSKRAEIDQINKVFAPQVSIVRTGTPVSFPNSDNIRHHVYSFSPAKTFDLKLYSGRPSMPVVFDKPGVVTLGCNIHDQMIAWILVVDTPWFAKTDAGGHATITNLAEGDYELHTWHPGVDAEPKAQSIRVNTAPIARSIRLPARSIAQVRHEISASGAH